MKEAVPQDQAKPSYFDHEFAAIAQYLRLAAACSFLELYNEETTDLLAVGEQAKAAGQKLRIMEDRSGVVVHGLEEMPVKTSDDIYALLDRGSAKRK